MYDLVYCHRYSTCYDWSFYTHIVYAITFLGNYADPITLRDFYEHDTKTQQHAHTLRGGNYQL